MGSKENKSESGKKPNKSSASTPDQKSKQDAKETGNERFSKKIIEQNENIQKQMQVFEEIFQKQNQMFEKQNQISNDLMRTLQNVLGKDTEREKEQAGKNVKEPENENKEYVLFRNAYRNLAQRNKSRENVVPIEVEVGKAYQKALADLENRRNVTTNTK